MKCTNWAILIFLIGLLGGCATTKISGDTYCDLSSPILFGSERTIEWLIANDRSLVVDVLVANETHQRICTDD